MPKPNYTELRLVPEYSDDLGPPSWVSPPVSISTIKSHYAPSQANHSDTIQYQVQPIPYSLASLHAAPQICEIQLNPQEVLVGHIMSGIATVNSWSRICPITTMKTPEALSWKKT